MSWMDNERRKRWLEAKRSNMPPTCRRCSECEGQKHHILTIEEYAEDGFDDGEDDVQHPAAKAGHDAWYPCKHCSAYVPITDAVIDAIDADRDLRAVRRRARAVRPREISVWCDGSGTHVEGPACIGVVIVGDAAESICEVSEHVGVGTNNVAELRAIRRGLFLADVIAGVDVPVTVYSDSEYAIGCCTKSWEIRANADLVRALRRQVATFAFIRFVHVDGHAGIYLNEVADWLAGEARRRYFAGHGIERKAKRRPERKDAAA